MGNNEPVEDADALSTDQASPHLQARARDAEWVRRAVAGDRDAFALLYDEWFDRVFNLALRVVRNRDVAEEVCQDAFLSAWRSLDRLEDPDAFGGWLLRIARNASFNRSDREARSRPVDDEGLTVIETTGSSSSAAPAGFGVEERLARADDPQIAAVDNEIAALVQDAVGALGERDAEVLDLQLRYELTPAEIGDVVGINRNAANQLCHRVRARFATAFGARMLWNGTRPACTQLEALLAVVGIDTFGAEAVKIADRHAAQCSECDERRQSRLEPSALFSAVPFVVAPAAFKLRVAASLASHGVPVHTPASAGSAPDPTVTQASTTASSRFQPALSRRRLVIAGSAALAVAAAVTMFVLVGSDRPVSSSDSAARASTDHRGATNDFVARRIDGAPTSRPGTVDTPGVTQPHPPGAGTGTTRPAPVSTPAFEVFALSPSTSQGSTWALENGPVLTWRVSGAASVEVWTWFDDGSSGPHKSRLVSTASSGTSQLCPGTLTTPNLCAAPAGFYTYVIEATARDGRVTSSDRTNPPGFRVVQTIQ